jgi:hypothetical protein
LIVNLWVCWFNFKIYEVHLSALNAESVVRGIVTLLVFSWDLKKEVSSMIGLLFQASQTVSLSGEAGLDSAKNWYHTTSLSR